MRMVVGRAAVEKTTAEEIGERSPNLVDVELLVRLFASGGGGRTDQGLRRRGHRKRTPQPRDLRADRGLDRGLISLNLKGLVEI
jgi:hypothetical protein